MALLIFQILSSIFGFANKLFLYLGKRTGWILGFLAGIFFVTYFFLIGFTVYAFVQIGFSLLMLYGFFSHSGLSKNARVVATVLLSLIALVITVITFNGKLTLLEALSALLASWGTYYLASRNNRKGWGMYLVAHLILIYLTVIKQQYIFALFQGMSAVISILAIVKKPVKADMIKVVIECEAGSDTKNVFDEVTFENKESFTISRAYPFPYGFIQGTVSGDGDCLDCFILTKQPLGVKDIIDAEVVGMFEQFETRDGVREEDHNVLAKLKGEDLELDDDAREALRDFVLHAWDHRVGKTVEVGNFYGRAEAELLIENLTSIKVE